jgi:hypothetical protein
LNGSSVCVCVCQTDSVWSGGCDLASALLSWRGPSAVLTSQCSVLVVADKSRLGSRARAGAPQQQRQPIPSASGPRTCAHAGHRPRCPPIAKRRARPPGCRVRDASPAPSGGVRARGPAAAEPSRGPRPARAERLSQHVAALLPARSSTPEYGTKTKRRIHLRVRRRVA